MIFAGDFAQLPPAIGQEHASLYSRTVGTTSSPQDQEAAIGKALWHQITTVVILEQNMRQKTQSPEDAQLRQALTNMRYKSCTPEDLVFLRSLISSRTAGTARSSIKQKEFRDVSIITALNVHKDEINRLGSLRFASETNQTLTDFFSEDTVSAHEEKKSARAANKAIRGVPVISDQVQQTLWTQPHSANTKNIPGKLSLCVGMPVMIRNNSATELCITKGQEATVHSWQSTVGSRGQRMLDTLFVTLVNPPQSVQIDGLPVDVVPLTRSSVHITCSLPDDTCISLNRNQVEVLPNFSMTDYASQGKTRPYNVVDLNNSRTHQAYYTALSRSASAAGTLILQGFDAKKITGGASGALRQEFRELELLNEITRLRYVGKLPVTVVGNRRNNLLHSFRQLKGENYVPAHVHKSIRWGKSDPFPIKSDSDTSEWCILPKAHKTKLVATPKVNTTLLPTQVTSFTSPQISPLLSKRKISGSFVAPCRKKLKTCHVPDELHSDRLNMPSGICWSNNSCAYDPTFSILFNIWLDDHISRSDMFTFINNEFLGLLAQSFTRHVNGEYTLEQVQDYVRCSLQRSDPAHFSWGIYTSVHSLINCILATEFPVITSKLYCTAGHIPSRLQVSNVNSCLVSTTSGNPRSLQGHLDNSEITSGSQCQICRRQLVRRYRFTSSPGILAFDVLGPQVSAIDHILNVLVNGQVSRYQLRGVVYHGADHFTSRIISSTLDVWFHDGISTGSSMVHEGTLAAFGDLTMCDAGVTRRRATVAIYVLVPHN